MVTSVSVVRYVRASRVCVPCRSGLVDLFFILAVFLTELLSLANWAPVIHCEPSMAMPFL